MNGFDDMFNKIDKLMEDIENGFYDSPSYNDFIDTLENDNYIYITMELGYSPTLVNVDIKEDRNGKYLRLELENDVHTYNLPSYVDKVEQFTIVNNILDIVIKKHDRV